MTQLVQSPPKPLAIRAPRALSHGPMHPVYLTGLRQSARSLETRPLIVERRDQEFVQGLINDLGDASAYNRLFASTPKAQGGTMRVFQPLQRVFNMLVLEAFCDVPGQPRVDQKQIESSGFVLRRVDGSRKLAWLKAGTQVFGWEAVDEDLDPASDRRANAVTLGHPMLDALAPSQKRIRTAGSARLAVSDAPVSEDVQPLFIAPPDACQRVARTMLFGNLRVASGELTEGPPSAPAFGTDDAERQQLRADMVSYLTEGGARIFITVGSQRNLSTEAARQAGQTPIDSGNQPAFSRAQYDALNRTLGALLQQLNNQYDAFGTGSGAIAMQAAIKQLKVETDVPAANGQPARVDKRDAWQFLLDTKAVLIDAVPGATVSLPDRWGAVSQAIDSAIFEASLVCMQQQFAKVLPAAGRFDKGRNGAEPHFVVRAFIRLKPEHDGCPSRLVWSGYSDEFTIAPWFESSGAPVPVIPLPDLMDREQLKRVKPTVAFALPPKLAKLLQGSSDDLMKGKGSGEGGIGLGWICSFSLPIITLCAFICLNVFLSLFNLIFQWMAFLKICIPIPKAKE